MNRFVVSMPSAVLCALVLGLCTPAAQAQGPSQAPSPESRAEALAETVCAACHGRNGLSISDTIPNLAGQRAPYLENQLRALREGTRKSGVMNAIAAQIAEADLRPLAAHYAAMAGAPAGAASRDRKSTRLNSSH